MSLEETYGQCWKALAASEGHQKVLPRSQNLHTQPGTPSVEARKKRIVKYLLRKPDLLAGDICKNLRLKRSDFSNDILALVMEGRVKWRTDLSKNRRYSAKGTGE